MILWIDQGLPVNDDFIRSNVPRPDVRSYFRIVNDFLDGFDDEVIIACHPGYVANNKNYWRGKKTVVRRTPEFIDKADLLIGHFSSTFDKTDKEKMFVIWIGLIKMGYIGDMIIKMAHQYGQEPIFINEGDFNDEFR